MRQLEEPAPEETQQEGIDESGIAAALRSRLLRMSVPEGRHSIWYYFGGLTLFLLLVMIASGVLLSTYYEPSAAPAVGEDGMPLVAARVLKDVEWNGADYRTGEIIPIPLDTAAGTPLPPAPLRGAVEIILEENSGEPLRPSIAWESIEGRIMHEAEFGSLIRSIHGYSANLLVVAIFIHMGSAFLMRSRRSPRGLIWTTGAVLLLLVLGFAFTGYLLPWNRLAYFATQVGTSLPEEGLPIIGPALASLVRGGDDVTGITLTRMYSAHVVALPMATLVFVGLHLLLIQTFGLARRSDRRRQGGIMVASMLGGGALLLLVLAPVLAGRFDPASPLVLIALTTLPVAIAYLLSAMATASPETAEAPGEIPFYGNFIYRNFLCWLLAFGTIITLATLSPWGDRGDLALPVDLGKPLSTPEGLRPEWYFMALYQLLRLLPGLPAALLMIAAGIFLFALPYIDRRAGSRHRIVTMTGVGLMAAAVALTVAGYAAGM